MSKSSLVFLLVWHPPLHIPYISSPNLSSFCSTCPYSMHIQIHNHLSSLQSVCHLLCHFQSKVKYYNLQRHIRWSCGLSTKEGAYWQARADGPRFSPKNDISFQTACFECILTWFWKLKWLFETVYKSGVKRRCCVSNVVCAQWWNVFMVCALENLQSPHQIMWHQTCTKCISAM